MRLPLQWIRKPKVLLYGAVFLAALLIGVIGTPRIANASIWYRSEQKESFLQVSNYYMHQWLIHEYNYCPDCLPPIYNRAYRNGMDSRWSWGGAGHNMYALLVQARAWVCGSLYWSHNDYLFDTYYHYADSPSTGWTTCGAQADFNARFYQPGVVDWWYYLNY